MPGVYVPPPPEAVPAWQQATHAPLQGGTKKFRYTKPTVDPSFYAQGYQPQQPQQPYGQPAQNQLQHQGQMQAGQFVQPNQPLQQQFAHAAPQPDHLQQQQHAQVQQPQQYNQAPQPQLQQQNVQQFQQSTGQWPQTQPTDEGYAQQQQTAPAPYNAQQPAQHQGWQQGAQSQGPSFPQQQSPAPDANIQSPKPLGHSNVVPPGFVNTASPESQPVSPMQSRQSISYASSQGHNLGRASSVSSIALDAIRNQRAQSITKESALSPAPAAKPATNSSSLQRSNTTGAYSALGAGGPSDWEHFGAVDEEIDDEDLFAGKKQATQELADNSTSVELPASQPDLPSHPEATEAWPTPPSQPVQPSPLNAALQQRDTFQPTPPPKAATPAQSQTFVMGDAVMPSQSPQPSQLSQPPPARQSFVMDDGGWVPPKQGTPAPHEPPHSQQSFVMDDGGWVPPNQNTSAPQDPSHSHQGFVMDDGGVGLQAQQRQATPNQHQVLQQHEQRQATPVQQQQAQHQPPLSQTNNQFVMGDSGLPSAYQAPPPAPGVAGGQLKNEQHTAELKAKDLLIERLKADNKKLKAENEKGMDDVAEQLASAYEQKLELDDQLEEAKGQRVRAEQETSNLRAELSKLKSEGESAKTQAASDQDVLKEQIQAMIATAQQLKAETDILIKEKDLLIERLKEDAEGKDDAVKERDAIIADLKRQLEAQKSKEVPKPTAADLIPDLDPWYAGSLERFITMLRSEANEHQVDEKIKVFTGFLRAESGARGLEYYSAPPPVPVQEPVMPAPTQEPVVMSREGSSISNRKPDMHVDVPQSSFAQDDAVQYSPGGRPIMQHKPMTKSNEGRASQQSFNGTIQEQGRPQSTASTTILTPGSSVDNDLDKTPIQSPPEEQPQPQYKAYVPPAGSSFVPDSAQRASISFSPPSVAPVVAPLNPSKHGKHDEIFFGEHQPTPKPESKPESKPASRPTTSGSSLPGESIPPPLNIVGKVVKVHSPIVPTAPKKSSVDTLAELLPSQIIPAEPHFRLQEIRAQLQTLPAEFAYITELTQKWEKDAAATRKANDEARRKRQEESEERTDQLFNDNEISYAEIGDIEEEFKEKERQLKAQEDRDEYKKYVEDVFNIVYETLQGDIKTIMDLYFETESLLHTSVAGVRALEGHEEPTTKEALEVLKELHTAAEIRHEKVAFAVSERDKRYKKTEIQPLYAAGNITKMKAVEKHFEAAEKQAAFRAQADKAVHLSDLVRVAQEVVVGAVAAEQGEVDAIVDSLRELDPAEDSKDEVLDRTRNTLSAIKANSVGLLTMLNTIEEELASAVCEADLVEAKAHNADLVRLKEIEKGSKEAKEKLEEEFQRKLRVLDQSDGEVKKLLEEKALSPASGAAAGGGVSILTPMPAEGAPAAADDERKRRMKAALEEARRRNGEL